MYPSRLFLNPRSAQARRDLGDPYEMHRSLVRAFVTCDDQVPPRFLWRLELPSRIGEIPVLLIQSEQMPEFSPLEAIPSYLIKKREHEGQPSRKFVDLEKWVEEGRGYRFRLVANPTVSRSGRRHGLAGEADQLAWLSRQGARHGFGVESALVVGSSYLKSRKGQRAAQDTMSVLCVHYEGILRVSDPARLRRALLIGVGPGKALGCGLLSLARTNVPK